MNDIPVTIAWVTLVTEYYKQVITCNYDTAKDVGSEIIDSR